MNLVQIGFISLTLLALADGFLVAPGGGYGGISGILGILLLFLFIAALAKNTEGTDVAGCPVNYTQIPNDPTSCIRFVSSPTKNWDDAIAACVSDGGNILKLSTATFPFIKELAQDNGGTCDYWVGAYEDTDDGIWFNVNDEPIPTTTGIFFTDPTNDVGEECGVMTNAINFFLFGKICTELQCYICQKDI